MATDIRLKDKSVLPMTAHVNLHTQLGRGQCGEEDQQKNFHSRRRYIEDNT